MNTTIVPGKVKPITIYDQDVTSVKNVGALVPNARYALIQAVGGECRVRIDGVNATLTVGSIIEAKQWHPDLITDLNKVTIIGASKANIIGYIPE